MSRIGKQVINIPEGVTIKIDTTISVSGPKGELTMPTPAGFDFKLEANRLSIEPQAGFPFETKADGALQGLYRSLVANMVTGVSVGFSKILEINGVGYRATLNGNKLDLQLGYSHPVIVEAPKGIEFAVDKNTITISGIDKQNVGQIAANIREYKKPEPYKGKGIRYQGETIIRKAGKKAATSA
ncbi:MAG: 50S ribosomal protein L6 [Candidatus Yanofskybacteria bacterium CG10_big_fil_rev_8_21_14_0_10_46_23]|uniref:Large ribosomal subunit protein uL6 n=1 Tax=Candidatus Yanofskybacteria bacterium CG10_big_fil_rev_8_21_14_0_10_46_23 TaxID=1975098 RepID=A0A2H0R3U1_9BACT|nr:MAG: 50S ribosomal protein L6 [Candidatus Yanofskybacteria bacterium CG10_big_fil_rev_8_21_14_0_10_46_23]